MELSLYKMPWLEQTKKEKHPTKSLHNSLKYVVLFGQSLALLPVEEVTAPDCRLLNFKWKSPRTIYSIVSCIGTTFVVCIYLYRMISKGTDLFIISDVVLNCFMLTVSLFFIQLGRTWPRLMSQWHLVEMAMEKNYGWPHSLDYRLKVITIVAYCTAFVQYILLQVSRIVMAIKCHGNISVVEYYYAIENYEHVFSVMPYSIFLALIIQIVDVLTSFSWIYIDLFIIVMSTALSLRFQQVTSRVKIVGDSKEPGEYIWRELREDYNRLCRLCRSLDDAISYIVLISFAGNLFFILIQLFKSLRVMKNNLERVYFFVSFAFLILRTVFVSLYGAWINDESKKPVPILNSVPSSVYNLEIRRFIQQIGFDTVSLTGRNFFSVTRGLILSIAGAIVTYELVLIQFNENMLKENPVNNNTSSKC